jgi:hypothetical protein
MTRFLQGAALAIPLIFAGAASAADRAAVGSPAPAFKLQDRTWGWHSLSDYTDEWVVLYFYPKDDTPGCTIRACEFRDNIFAHVNPKGHPEIVPAELKQLMAAASKG